MRSHVALPGEGSIGADHDPFRDLRWVSSGIGLLSLFAMALTCWYGYILAGWRFQPQTLWALAIWASGGAVGFLFAIPRVLQGPRPVAAPGPNPASGAPATPTSASAPVYEQRVNTNLEEISDWLTKIIVGMTLVQLNQFPSLLSRLSSQVVSDLPVPTEGTGDSRFGYGIALIVGFFVLGFLFGYLVTRLYLQGALARAEHGLGDVGRVELERRALAAETSAELLGGVASHAMPAVVSGQEPSVQVRELLRQLADEYRTINMPDWEIRTRAKNRQAAKLFQAVVSHGVSREWLADQDDEALILALASAVHALPEPDDVERLLKVAPKVRLKHVRYRVASAFGRLIDNRLIRADVKPRVRAVLERFLTNADNPLIGLVRAVLNQLETV
jgi:hypothetical protein